MKPRELVLTTYKVATQVHSRTQNCKWLTEIYHDNPALINPETAIVLGISNGDTIDVKSAVGTLQTRVRVTPGVVPGVVAISHHLGHWQYGRYASGRKAPFGGEAPAHEHKWWKTHGAHPNWIVPNVPDPVNGQQCWMDPVVTVTRAAAA